MSWELTIPESIYRQTFSVTRGMTLSPAAWATTIWMVARAMIRSLERMVPIA